jgi:hypothetical protein
MLNRPRFRPHFHVEVLPGEGVLLLSDARHSLLRGRLYDVPVQLGWLARPLAEHEVNPIPLFL